MIIFNRVIDYYDTKKLTDVKTKKFIEYIMILVINKYTHLMK